MINKIIIFISIIVIPSISNIFDMYGSYEKDSSMTLSKMIPVYTGLFYVTGGFFNNSIIRDTTPTLMGEIKSNEITIISENYTLSFDTIEYYKVTDKISSATFYIMSINSTIGNDSYNIIIELRRGLNYERILFLYKNDKKRMMLFWKDKNKSKIVNKKAI
jgi:hypothetical protein